MRKEWFKIVSITQTVSRLWIRQNGLSCQKILSQTVFKFKTQPDMPVYMDNWPCFTICIHSWERTHLIWYNKVNLLLFQTII